MTSEELENFIKNYVVNKIEESKDKNYIRYTFYELRIKYNLSEEEVDEFLKLARTYYENNDYKVYFTGAKFVYKDAKITVQPNEYLIAIKDEKEQ